MAYRPTSDRILFITTTLLTVFGLVMVYSASSAVASSKYGASSYFFIRQLAFAAAGYVLMIALMQIDYRIWEKEKMLRYLLIGCAGMLVLVFSQPTVNHAHRWFRYGPLSFQPSEIAKLVLLIFLASYLRKYDPEINDLRTRLLPCLAVVGLYAGLIAIEPDLGQALCIIAITVLLLFLAGLSWVYITGAFLHQGFPEPVS